MAKTRKVQVAPDDEIIVLPIEKADGASIADAIEDGLITEWNQSGKKLIKYPLDLGTLLRASIMGPYHKRCLIFKRVAAIGAGYDTDKPAEVEAVLPRKVLTAFVDDQLTFANAYLERETNAQGNLVALHHIRANSLWKSADGGFVQKVINPEKEKAEWLPVPAEKIVHHFEYSPLSDHYGVPDYVPALLPVAVAYEADDFHRKFYQNGAHAGVVILLKGFKSLSQKQREDIEAKFAKTKGPGHFRNILLGIRDPDAEVQVIGVAKESPVRDDYPEINKSSREKVISAHGVPPRLMSIILDSKNGAITGQLPDEIDLFNISWVGPFQLLLEDFLNPLLPAPIKFRPFAVEIEASKPTDAG